MVKADKEVVEDAPVVDAPIADNESDSSSDSDEEDEAAAAYTIKQVSVVRNSSIVGIKKQVVNGLIAKFDKRKSASKNVRSGDDVRALLREKENHRVMVDQLLSNFTNPKFVSNAHSSELNACRISRFNNLLHRQSSKRAPVFKKTRSIAASAPIVLAIFAEYLVDQHLDGVDKYYDSCDEKAVSLLKHAHALKAAGYKVVEMNNSASRVIDSMVLDNAASDGFISVLRTD
jgi:hypothetical protein